MNGWNDVRRHLVSGGIALLSFALWSANPGVLRAESPEKKEREKEERGKEEREKEASESAEADTSESSKADETTSPEDTTDAERSSGEETPEGTAIDATTRDLGPDGGYEGEGEVLARNDALETAVEKNHDVEISATETEIAERNASLGNAGFLPRVQAVGSQTHLFGGSGLFGQSQFFTRTSLGIEANWLLFGGFGRFSTYDRLKIARSVQELERRAQIEQTLAEVSVAYYDVVRQRELLRAFEETREVSEERLTIARSRLQAGTGSQVDANLAKVELYRDRSRVADQRIAITQAKTELNRLMGREADREFRVQPAIKVASGLEYDAVRSRALEANRRLRAARRRRELATERVHERRADRWPEVRLSLGYNYTEFHNGLAPRFDVPAGLEYGVNVVVPIFDGFNINRRIANAESERTVRDTEVRREETRVRKAVRDAYAEYNRHLERIEFARKSVDLADENVEVALAELEAGTITQVELRQVQLNLQDARTRLIDAKYNAKRAELRLRRLTGDLYGRYVE